MARGNEVSTGSGSDGVTFLPISIDAWVATRSLPLPVLTPSSRKLIGHYQFAAQR